MKTSHREPEVKWLDLLIMSIRGREWMSVFEMRERFDALIPPHAIYRKARTWHRGRLVTIHSLKLTLLGGVTRYAMRKGFVERTAPIGLKGGKNIGNYDLRLTAKGVERAKRIRRYICTKCLHTGITRPTKAKTACCGKCRTRYLTFY